MGFLQGNVSSVMIVLVNCVRFLQIQLEMHPETLLHMFTTQEISQIVCVSSSEYTLTLVPSAQTSFDTTSSVQDDEKMLADCMLRGTHLFVTQVYVNLLSDRLFLYIKVF